MPPPPLLSSVLREPAPSIYPRTHVAQPENTAPFFAAQRDSWRSPEDILTILMLIGGDIVQCAVAQLAGTGPWYFTPVAFSFGWVGYAVQALMSAIGNGRLMPEPDCSSQVINGKSGYARENQSWVLGRLLRDHEQNKVKLRDNAGEEKVAALTIVFYEVEKIGKPARDWIYWAGVITILVQLGIALIPGLLHGNWLVLVVTVGGTLLALIGSGLPQWTQEKYAGRDVKKRDLACITRGNGANYAMVLISDGVGIRVEDMASGREKNSWKTSVCTAVLSVLWIVLLLTVEGLDGDAWYMLAVGGLGMVQNVVAAGARRSAAALGFHFQNGAVRVVAGSKVMDVLRDAEDKEPGVGCALLPIYFPGSLRENEEKDWEERRKSRETRAEAKKREREDTLKVAQAEFLRRDEAADVSVAVEEAGDAENEAEKKTWEEAAHSLAYASSQARDCMRDSSGALIASKRGR